jgi:MscS family membrane protein
MFDTLYYGNTVGEWLSALLLIVLSLLIGRITYWIFGRWIKHLARKSQTRLDDIIIDMIEEPLVVIITLFGIRQIWLLAEFVPSADGFRKPV